MINFVLFVDVYHTTFDMPSDQEVASRLEEVQGYDEETLVENLVIYHRHIDGIIQAYTQIHKTINADQPKADVFSQGRFLFLKIF